MPRCRNGRIGWLAARIPNKKRHDLQAVCKKADICFSPLNLLHAEISIITACYCGNVLSYSEVSEIESLMSLTQVCQSGKQIRASTDDYRRRSFNNAHKTAISA